MFCHGGSGNSVDDQPLAEGRSVAFPPPEPEIEVQVATTPVPEPEFTVEVGNRPRSLNIWKKLCCIRLTTTTRYSPSRPAYRPRVVTNNQPLSTLNKSHAFTLGPLAFTAVAYIVCACVGPKKFGDTGAPLLWTGETWLTP